MTASKEYAQALFALGVQANDTELYLSALKGIKEVVENNPKYLEFLACPSIAPKERTGAIKNAFEGKIPQNVLNFLCLLCEKGHINELFETINEFYELYKEANRIISAEVISAAELSDDQKQRLKEKLEKLYKCKVQITYSLDKSLLGGVTVKVAGKVLDQSLKHRLKSIKEVINQ